MKLKNIYRKFLVFCLIFSMAFSGWPKIWQNSPIMSGVQEALAADITLLDSWEAVYHNAAYPGAGAASFAVSSGSNRLLVVGISSSRTTAGTQTMTSVTYGGVPMTLATGDAGTSSVQHTYIYYLTDNAVMDGTNKTLAVSMSGGTSRYNTIFKAVYTGVDQANPIADQQTVNHGAGTGTNPITFSPDLNVNTGEQAIKVINGTRTGSTFGRTITGYGTDWSSAVAEQTWAATDSGRNAVGIRTIPGSDTTDAAGTTWSGTCVKSQSGIVLKRFIAESGSIVSTGIDFSRVPDATSWDEVFVGATTASGNGVTVEVLDATQTPISGKSCVIQNGGTSGFIDLSDITATGDNATLYLRATLSGTGGDTPYLNNWTIAWLTDGDPPIVSITDPISSQTLINMSPKLITGSADDSGTKDSDIASAEVRIRRDSDDKYWDSTLDGGNGDWDTPEYWNTATASDGDFDSSVEDFQFSWNFKPASQDGSPNYTIDARATDAANNTGDATQVTGVKIDNQAPLITSFEIGSGDPPYVNTTNVTLYSNVSGATTMAYSNDDVSYTTSAYSASSAWTFDGTNGSKTVYAKYIDGAGNQSDTTDTVDLDDRVPQASEHSPPSGSAGAYIGGNITVKIIDPDKDGYNSEIDSSTINDTNFYLKDSGGVTVSASVSYAGSIAILNPDASLELNETYTAYHTADIKDNAGNSLPADNWSFTTEAVSTTGDVTITNIAKGPASAVQGAQKKVTQVLELESSGQNVTVSSIKVKVAGAASDVQKIHIFRDANNDGVYDAGDTHHQEQNYTGAGYYTFMGLNYQFNDTQYFAVAATVDSGATISNTFETQIEASGDVTFTQVNDISWAAAPPAESGVFTITEATPKVDGVTVIAAEKPDLTISWDLILGATYRVERATSTSGPWTVLVSGHNSDSYVDSEVKDPKMYYYRVFANRGGDDSDEADIASTLDGNDRVMLTTAISGGAGGTIESADGQVNLVVPANANNNGDWTIQQEAPPVTSDNSERMPKNFASGYFSFSKTGAAATGTFDLTLTSYRSPGSYQKVLWRYNGSIWENNSGSNYSWAKGPDSYYRFSAEVTGFSGYLLADGVFNNTAPKGPHGSYTTTSNKCKDCHAVHDAELVNGQGYKLLRGGAQENVCNFCHGDQGVASVREISLTVSGHGPVMTSGTVTAPDDIATGQYTFNAGPMNTWSCLRCHTPHDGQSITLAFNSTTKLLKVQPNPNKAALAPGATLSEWCAKCHEANLGTYGQSKIIPDGAGTTIAYGHDVSTGGMQTTAYGGSVYASVGQNISANPNRGPTCRQCHVAGSVGVVTGQLPGDASGMNEGNFPHGGGTQSYGLLKQDARPGQLDDVCNDCHYTPSLP